MSPPGDPQIPKISKNKKCASLALIMKVSIAIFVQIELKMEPGDCPPLNINAMWDISVKSFLKMYNKKLVKCVFFPTQIHFWFPENNFM